MPSRHDLWPVAGAQKIDFAYKYPYYYSMVKISQITQELLAFGLEKNTYRRVFYRFLKYFYPSRANFGRACVKNFYSTMARLNNWQVAQKSIDSYMQLELAQLAERYRLDFKAEDFLNLQLCSLNNTHDVKQLIGTRLKMYKNIQIYFLHSCSRQHIVMLRKPQYGFKIESYTNKAFVVNGGLQCLSPGTQLYYNAGSELMSKRRQFYWCPIMGWALFEQQSSSYRGVLVQGPHLRPHKFSTTLQPPHSDLFYAIKNIEKHFIDPASDSFYQSVLKKINFAHQALQSRHPDARALAAEVLREVVVAKDLFVHHASIQNALCDLKTQLIHTKGPLNNRHLML